MNKKNIFIYCISTIFSLILYIYIIRPGGFNILPFTIHEYFFKGEGNELLFIFIFDFAISFLVWRCLFKGLQKILSYEK